MTRILVVDDNPIIQRMLAYVVEAQGYEAVRARDGVDALKRLEEKPFDLVISDIKMPEMDGLALLNHIRSSSATATIPVLLLTARLDAYQEISANTDDRTAFLTKPLASSELVSALSEMLAASG